jgi:hypothetical protein
MLSLKGCQDDQNTKRKGLEPTKVYLKTPSEKPTVTQLGGDRTHRPDSAPRPVVTVEQPRCATSRDSKLAVNSQRAPAHVDDRTHRINDQTQRAARVRSSLVSVFSA